jgi:hypothetical protein
MVFRLLIYLPRMQNVCGISTYNIHTIHSQHTNNTCVAGQATRSAGRRGLAVRMNMYECMVNKEAIKKCVILSLLLMNKIIGSINVSI